MGHPLPYHRQPHNSWHSAPLNPNPRSHGRDKANFTTGLPPTPATLIAREPFPIPPPAPQLLAQLDARHGYGHQHHHKYHQQHHYQHRQQHHPHQVVPMGGHGHYGQGSHGGPSYPPAFGHSMLRNTEAPEPGFGQSLLKSVGPTQAPYADSANAGARAIGPARLLGPQ